MIPLGMVSAHARPTWGVASVGLGQSLSLSRAPLVTTGSSSQLLTVAGGVEAARFADYAATDGTGTMQWVDFSTLTQLVESGGAESWGSGMGYQFLQDASVGRAAFFSAGTGGMAYSQLRRGSPNWSWAMCAMDSMVKAFRAQGRTVRPDWTWTQGEADCDTLPPGGSGSESPVTQAEYLAILTQLIADLREDTSLIFGEVRSDPVFVTPLLSAAWGAPSRNVQNAQIQAALTVDGIILLPSPCQFCATYETDLIHKSGIGIRYYAEAAALAKRQVWGGSSWSPLHMVSAVRSGAEITATFNKTAVIDTTTIPETTAYANQKYGFEFYDDGVAININAVSVTGAVATITLASTPSGTLKELRMSQQPGTGTNSASTHMPRSNIRDVSPLGTSEDGTILYDFAVPQSVTVS